MELIRFHQLFLITILWQCILLDSVKCQCGTTTVISGTVQHKFVENAAVVYTCNNGNTANLFKSGNTALLSTCNGTQWTSIDDQCNETSIFTACGNEFTAAPNFSKPVVDTSDAYNVYTCKSNNSWVSGNIVSMTQCKNGSWTPIYDICDIECVLPKECSGISDLGFAEDGKYMANISSLEGNAIFCVLNESMPSNGGKWTYIFHNTPTSTLKTNSEYVYGYGNMDVEYFIGLKNLHELTSSYGEKGTAGVVLEILFYKNKVLTYYATYENFTVGDGYGYPITSLGTYHGNAGDGMCPLLNQNFTVGNLTLYSTATLWWGVTTDNWNAMNKLNGNFLPDSLKWAPLAGSQTTFTNATMRIRPIEEDRKLACPPIVGSENWTYTELYIPYDRTPGANISYKCTNPMYMEGMEGGDRTREGTIVCRAGEYPKWSRNITLPCTMTCPENFVLNNLKTKCYSYSTMDATNIIDASQKCLAMNSTLAVLGNSLDMSRVEQNMNYFVSNMKHYNTAELLPSLQSDLMFNCTESSACNIITEMSCTIVYNDYLYKHVNCQEPYRYICEIPTWCPPGYNRVDGACYAVLDDVTSFMDALTKCSLNGSGLAYPANMTLANNLYGFLKMNITDLSQQTNFYIGLTNVLGTWNNDVGNLESMLQSSAEDKWRLMTLKENDYLFTPADIYSNILDAKAVCQYPAPLGCNSAPPSALENMTYNGGNETFSMENSIAEYACQHGYFVNGNISLMNQTVACIGMLGGWYPTLLPCVRVPVCENNTPVVLSDKVSNITSDDSFFLDGVISYSCPEGTGFQDKNVTKNTTCGILDGVTSEYGFDIIQIPVCDVCLGSTNFSNATSTWTEATVYNMNTTIDVTCDSNFEFSFGNATQTVTCTDMGWDWSSVMNCYAVCSASPPVPEENIVPFVVTDNKIDTIQTYKCESGYYFLPTEQNPDPFTQLNVTCDASTQTWTSSHNVSEYTCFKMCLEDPEPFPEFSNYSWNNIDRLANATVTYTCDAGYKFGNFSSTMVATCDGTNWILADQSIFTCQKFCEGPPDPRDINADPFNDTTTYSWLNSNLEYVCPDGFADVNGTQSVIISCTDNGWGMLPTGFQCLDVCIEPPPENPPLSNSTWTGTNRKIDDTVVYTCQSEYAFGDFLGTWTMTCNGTHWYPINESLFSCSKACNGTPTITVPNVETANSSSSPIVWLNEKLIYECPSGQANKDGNRSFSLACTDSGWQPEPTDFLCEKACDEPPPQAPPGASSNFSSDIREGVAVKYVCSVGKFIYYYEPELVSICINQSWDIATIPGCVSITTPDPSLSTTSPVILPPVGNNLHYDFTADYSWSEIQDQLTDISGDTNHQVTNGPFGFGLATGLQSINEQCIKQENFVSAAEECVLSPSRCAEGLSFSIWAKPTLAGDLTSISEVDDTSKYKYIVSTGGDTDGHPGFSIMHQSLWLIALISTGENYWKVRVFDAVMNDSWNNIGVVWHQDAEGLQLYVNLTQVGQIRHPQSATPQLPLNPSELIMGCHRDSSNAEYRGFNDVEVDEFAIWREALNNSGILWLAGGYQENQSMISVEEFQAMINNVEISDPAQQGAAVNILEKLTQPIISTTDASPTAAENLDATSPTATSPIFINKITTPEIDPESVDELIKLAEILKVMLNTKKLPKNITSEVANGYMKISRVVGNVFDEDKSRAWIGVQESTDEVGAMQTLDQYTKYKNELYRRIFYSNTSQPFCYSSSTDNMLDENCKMRVGDLRENGGMLSKPNYNGKDLRKFKELWNLPYDRAAFPSRVFQDGRCDERPVNIHITLFDSVPDYADTTVNPSVINPLPIQALDSRILSFYVDVDPAYNIDGSVDTSEPLCIPDPEVFRKDPFRYKLEHKTHIKALRKLMFHEDEVVTDIAVRRCAWWNTNISDFGGWDTTGCMMLQSTDDYTKCACDRFGIFAIVAEKIDPIVVPTEPKWLKILKYVLYGISAVAVVLYIIVVVVSGDLKDQFHLMGLNVAVCILVGSIAMVITDFEEVRSDRHTCVAFGTLIHFFYGALGVWMCALGHASFKAITAGVIGGRLRPYMCISWGMALAFTGVPYIAYLHDLGTDPRCFIGWNNDVKLIFFVPQVACAGAAMFFAMVIICNLSTPALRKENLIEDYGSFCRGAGLLLILLSLTWVFGMLAYVDFDLTEPDFYPIFQVLNSVAGFSLFIFIGMGSNRFRMFIAGQAKSRKKLLNKFAFGKPLDPNMDGTRNDEINADW